MQVSAEQAAFMQFLARLMGVRRYLEIGVFTGYSTLSVGLALKQMQGLGAYILACDASAEWTAQAAGYWTAAGVEDIIDLQVRPALETLDARIASGEAGSYDLAFIDADKTSYGAYFERTLALLRPGGVMLFDNMLWSGAVADPEAVDPETSALRAVAQTARDDPRVEPVLVAIGDGVLMCLKR
jgi:caffeoyl-CoA O-methyltransferase